VSDSGYQRYKVLWPLVPVMAIMGSIVAGATDLTGAEGPGNFAAAMETAFYVGAAMLGLGFILARVLMPEGKQEGIE
jgi:hypothetical protein